MKKQIVALLAGAMLMLASTSFALPLLNVANDNFEDLEGGAVYATYQNSGDFLFIKSGNNEGNLDTQLSVQTALNSYFGFTESNLITLTATTVNYTDPQTPSGTWMTAPTGNTIDFYVIKAANAYAMYQVNPADSNGSWSTYDLNAAGYGGESLDISHFTGYNPSAAPVPEPGTMMLFGIGMLGLAVYGKRRMNKEA